MNLQDLRYLVAIADHRHFGRAAEACFVSQPTLSTQLRKLEKELGVDLVERNPRHVMLTEIGERVVERARTMLREEAAIGEIARQAQDPEAGTVRIGLFPTLGPYLLPHVVPALHASPGSNSCSSRRRPSRCSPTCATARSTSACSPSR
jgi:LysR family hydrogen peroxide-inducible transcriptional activator